MIPPPAKAPLTSCVLIVDDSADFCQYVASILNLGGFFRFRFASNGVEAVESIKAHLPDLVVMDMVMPQMTGLHALRVIRRMPEGQNLPVVILTAMGDYESLQGPYAATEVLHKPVDPRRLISVCRRLVEGTALPEETEFLDGGDSEDDDGGLSLHEDKLAPFWS